MQIAKLFFSMSMLLSLTNYASARSVTIDVDQVRDISAGCLTTPLPLAPPNAAKTKVKSKYNNAQFEVAFWYEPCLAGAKTRLKTKAVMLMQISPVAETGKSNTKGVLPNFEMVEDGKTEKISFAFNDDGVTNDDSLLAAPTSLLVKTYWQSGRTESVVMPNSKSRSIIYKLENTSFEARVENIPTAVR
jgi:hypothetical protein